MTTPRLWPAVVVVRRDQQLSHNITIPTGPRRNETNYILPMLVSRCTSIAIGQQYSKVHNHNIKSTKNCEFRFPLAMNSILYSSTKGEQNWCPFYPLLLLKYNLFIFHCFGNQWNRNYLSLLIEWSLRTAFKCEIRFKIQIVSHHQCPFKFIVIKSDVKDTLHHWNQ